MCADRSEESFQRLQSFVHKAGVLARGRQAATAHASKGMSGFHYVSASSVIASPGQRTRLRAILCLPHHRPYGTLPLERADGKPALDLVLEDDVHDQRRQHNDRDRCE